MYGNSCSQMVNGQSNLPQIEAVALSHSWESQPIFCTHNLRVFILKMKIHGTFKYRAAL